MIMKLNFLIGLVIYVNLWFMFPTYMWLILVLILIFISNSLFNYNKFVMNYKDINLLFDDYNKAFNTLPKKYSKYNLILRYIIRLKFRTIYNYFIKEHGGYNTKSTKTEYKSQIDLKIQEYLDILEINFNELNKDNLKKQYRLLAKLYHPDNKKTGCEKTFKKINEANQFLSKFV